MNANVHITSIFELVLVAMLLLLCTSCFRLLFLGLYEYTERVTGVAFISILALAC